MFLALQHVLTMFNGVVIVPTIVAKGTHIAPERIEFVAFASILVPSVSTFICRYVRHDSLRLPGGLIYPSSHWRGMLLSLQPLSYGGCTA